MRHSRAHFNPRPSTPVRSRPIDLGVAVLVLGFCVSSGFAAFGCWLEDCLLGRGLGLRRAEAQRFM